MSDHKPFTLPPGEGAKVCVGGGAGFIGSHIAKRLKENGYHVTVVGAFLCFAVCGLFRVSYLSNAGSYVAMPGARTGG